MDTEIHTLCKQSVNTPHLTRDFATSIISPIEVKPEVGKCMKAGFVVRIRVNPTDCLSILDTMRSVGVIVENMSFSSLASLTLSTLLASMRKAGTIPTRDGFEYAQMMRPFEGAKSTHDKRAITESLYLNAAHGLELPKIVMPTVAITNGHAPTIREMALENLSPEELVEEYHSLKKCFVSHSLTERERYEGIQTLLDKLNSSQ